MGKIQENKKIEIIEYKIESDFKSTFAGFLLLNFGGILFSSYIVSTAIGLYQMWLSDDIVDFIGLFKYTIIGVTIVALIINSWLVAEYLQEKKIVKVSKIVEVKEIKPLHKNIGTQNGREK